MNIAVWVIRVLLAVIFLAHGAAFVKQPPTVRAELEDGELSLRNYQLLGVAEICGAIAITLLPALGVLPWLDALALLGLAVVLLGATVIHVRRREIPQSGFTLALLAGVGVVVLSL